ncbi:MAG: hypothetical protein L6V88_04015 [Anaerotruncus sp.]|nr:MAG: hypothetical protein L6V88_04015 [Anaerotruncus sp.]
MYQYGDVDLLLLKEVLGHEKFGHHGNLYPHRGGSGKKSDCRKPAQQRFT